jgi:four helix bundle protein
MKLVMQVYAITREFPDEERFGLTAEIRECAVAVPSSIAEGYGRRAPDEYRKRLNAALGSLFALETQLMLATEMGLLTGAAFAETSENIVAITRMLKSFISKMGQRKSGTSSGESVPAASGSFDSFAPR